MNSKFGAAWRVGLLLSLWTAPAIAGGGETDPTAEYAKKIKSAQVIQTLGPDLVGDSTNLYTGATSFNVVDVSVPGNSGLPVAVGRKFNVEIDHWEAHQPNPGVIPMQRLFGDWDLDIPYLSGIYENQTGWRIDSTTPDKRCSVLNQQRVNFNGQTVAARGSPPNDLQWWPTEFWHGVDLHLAGGGSQSLLVATDPSAIRPQVGAPYHWTTKGDWWFSCLDATSNGKPGEAFIGRSPTGEIYRFEHLSERRVTQLWERICALDGIVEPQGDFNGECPHRRMPRKEVMLLPTEVTDRFGNWVRYHWSGDTFARLESITSSDGRSITLHYDSNGLVDWVSDGTRTWVYQYIVTETLHTLRTVLLPDGSNWEYGLTGLPVEGIAMSCADIGEAPFCYSPTVASGTGSGYIKHPSGARVEFTAALHFKPTINGAGAGGGSHPLGLLSKKVSGPGLAAATWTYSYWPTRAQFLEACGPNRTTCPTQIYTDAVGPDGSMTRSYFGIELNVSQGLLLSEQRGKPNGSVFEVLSTTTYSYANPYANNGFLAKVGTSPQAQSDGQPNETEYYYPERRLPLQVRSTTQQGATFTNSTTAFSEFAKPVSVTRSSSGLAGPATGYSRTEVHSYLDVPQDMWIVGLPKKTTSAGYTVSETIYNAKALPEVTKQFDQVTATYAYNSSGNLISITDGNGKTTTLSSWHRGVPQAIGFPSTKVYPSMAVEAQTQAATVDNLGNLTEAFDEYGTKTSYEYDVMGRLKTIGYQAETSPAQSWNPLARSVVKVACNDIGIADSCWRQTVSTGSTSGSGKTTTWYDARFQPVLTLTEDTSNAATKSYVLRRFDAFGRETFVSYPIASANVNSTPNGIVTEYDVLGRPVKVKQDSELDTLITETTYLPGLQTQVKNPREFSTTTSFQVFDNPAEAVPVKIEAPHGVTTTIVRDLFGAPLSITRQGPGG